METITQKKIEEIRNTPNIDFSNRDKSKVFYVSSDNDDSNNGLSEATPITTLKHLNELGNGNNIPSVLLSYLEMVIPLKEI